MHVRTLPTTETITVTLTLGNTVQLANPELWHFINGHDGQIPVSGEDASTATWSDIPAPQQGGLLDLTVFWNAFEPQHDQWIYPAIIEVTDQDGERLTGVGSSNPNAVPCKIGELQPSFGRGSHAVFVEA
ncbi:hypothetical protein [Caulobacter segnis]|jgi:hypothetical protein|uniref:hypothetical protein n=1 Tax=Caulobacter segnis TaxID=88688 RepID=UPI00285BCC86|nr:hypothetical protein [Caulobacter segnis]MDR6624312.1 hypothetical protein [Caulobacter segnis]